MRYEPTEGTTWSLGCGRSISSLRRVRPLPTPLRPEGSVPEEGTRGDVNEESVSRVSDEGTAGNVHER